MHVARSLRSLDTLLNMNYLVIKKAIGVYTLLYAIGAGFPTASLLNLVQRLQAETINATPQAPTAIAKATASPSM